MMKLKRWEIALAVSLLAALLFCALPVRAQTALADKMVRLHVVANSDDADDQARKLVVRDAVLAAAQGAEQVDDRLLWEMERAGRAALRADGCEDTVTVRRVRMWFDTRDYGTFALPAGEYDAVRVVIGAGAGHNWWCVLFPPLCAGTCEEEWTAAAARAGLTEGEIAFITGEDTGCVLRFRLAEFWGKLLRPTP